MSFMEVNSLQIIEENRRGEGTELKNFIIFQTRKTCHQIKSTNRVFIKRNLLNFRPGMWKCRESCSEGVFSPIRNERRPQLLWESALLRMPTQFCRPKRSEQSQIRSGCTALPLAAVCAQRDVRLLVTVFKTSVMFNL